MLVHRVINGYQFKLSVQYYVIGQVVYIFTLDT